MYKVWYLLWNFISQYMSWKMCMFAFLLLQGYSILLSDSRGTFLTLSCFPPSCQNLVFLFVYWRAVFSMALIPLSVFQPSLVICISLSLSHRNVYFLVWTLYLTPFNYFKDDVTLQSVCGWFGRWRKRARKRQKLIWIAKKSTDGWKVGRRICFEWVGVWLGGRETLKES